MIGKLSVYMLLLLLIPDIYIYKFFIARQTQGSYLGWLWFIPTILLLLGMLWIVFSSRHGDIGQEFIGLFTIIYMAIVIPKTIFALCSLLDLPLKYLLKWETMPFSWLGAALGVIVTGAVIYGAIWGKKQFEVKDVVFSSPNLPAAFDGYRLAQISDLHAGSWGEDREAMQKAIDLINAQQANVILFTGDLVNNMASELTPFKDILSRLNAPDGVFSILGNHDYGPYHRWPSPEMKKQNLLDLKSTQADMGWQLLNNEHTFLKQGTDSIALIGVENNGEPPFSQYSDLPKAMLGTETADFKLLLSHNPTHWRREVLNTDIDLMLAGHTHAMQLALGHHSPSSLIYPEWSGLYTEGKKGLYVNAGLGYLGLMPLRIGAWPEITVITLRKENASE